MEFEYRKVPVVECDLWQSIANIDGLIWSGIYELRVKDIDKDAVGSPFCTLGDNDIVKLFVSDYNPVDNSYANRIIVQNIVSDNFPNNEGVYTRTCNSVGGKYVWSTWTCERKIVDVGKVDSFDDFKNSGVYSGTYTAGDGLFESFIMQVVNNSLIVDNNEQNGCVSQSKFSLYSNGLFSHRSRIGEGNDAVIWGDWVDIGAADTTDIQDNSITAPKLSCDVREKVELIGQQMSINIVVSAYTDYKIVLPKGSFIIDLGGYDGNLLLSTAYPFNVNSRVSLNKELLPYCVPIDVQSVRPSKDMNNTVTIVTGLKAASLEVEKSMSFKCAVTASGYGANSYIPVNSLIAMDKGRALVSVQGTTLPKYLWLGMSGASQADATRIAIEDLPFVLPYDVKKLWLDVSTSTNPINLITISADSDEYRELLQEKRIASIEGSVAELTPRSYAMPRISGDMPDGTVLTLEKNSVKTFKSLAFTADIVSFGENGRLLLGHGRESEKRYGASWIEIDNEYLRVKTWFAADNIQTYYYKHELTIEHNIQVLLSVDTGNLSVRITTGGNTFIKGELEWNCNGTIFAEAIECELSDASLSWSCKNVSADIWAFGDSYFGTTNESRWIKHLLDAGYHNILVNGYAGEASSDALADLNALLQHGTPKYIFWCLGMNNADTSTAVDSTWKSVLESVKALCNENGIELVLATIPTVPSRVNKYKNAIVRSSGYRFVDFDKAVGADESTGAWYDGMLSSDGVHPSSKGAVALFHRAIADFPELMMAKRME